MRTTRTILFTTFILAPLSVYSAVVSYQCHYPEYSDNEGGLNKSNDFALEFQYDTVTQDAFVVGNNGLSPVAAVKGLEGITFLEILPTGAVQSTTVTHNGKSVHSRHSMMFNGGLIPSQYYGKCNLEE